MSGPQTVVGIRMEAVTLCLERRPPPRASCHTCDQYHQRHLCKRTRDMIVSAQYHRGLTCKQEDLLQHHRCIREGRHLLHFNTIAVTSVPPHRIPRNTRTTTIGRCLGHNHLRSLACHHLLRPIFPVAPHQPLIAMTISILADYLQILTLIPDILRHLHHPLHIAYHTQPTVHLHHNPCSTTAIKAESIHLSHSLLLMAAPE